MPMQPLPPKVPPTLASNEDARESIVPVRARMRGSKLVGLIDNEGRDMGLPLTLSENSSGGVTNWDVAGLSIAGHVVYSALPNLNGHLRADGRTYSISAFPELAKRLGRISNGLSAMAARSSAADNNWYSVCWSPERALFVAVGISGTGNRVMTSPDGIAWTARTSAADNSWLFVCWSPELSLFAAISVSGSGNRVMTSPDGITWTTRASAADNSWRAVCWSPERAMFVAVAASGTGNRVMTSSDGITWTARTSAADIEWTGVCWAAGPGVFIAISQTGSGNRVMTSSDGITWAARPTPADNSWSGICWSPELSTAVVVGRSGTGNRVMTAYGCTYNPLTDFAVPKITAPVGCYAHIFAG